MLINTSSSFIAARFTLAASAVTLLALVSLHVLSPEITPSWHMVSEYAFGEYGGLLSAFFFAWGAAYLALAFTMLPFTQGWLARLALLLLVITGIGAVMGGLFDIRHPLHGLAFGIGVPFLPIATFILGRYLPHHYTLAKPKLMGVVRHAPWVSLVLMGIAMVVFINALKAAGAFHPEGVPHLWASLPDGIPKVVGYFNRLLIVAYLVSILILADAARHLRPSS